MYLLILVALSASLVFAQPQGIDASQSDSPGRSHKNASTRNSHSSSSGSCGTHCGTERWNVKTLTDGDAASLRSVQPKEKNIADLVAQRAPSNLPATRRVPFEKQLVKVHALLIGWKIESEAHGDQDFHIVIADPGDNSKQMIVEVPSPGCQGVCSSTFLENFKHNRQIVGDKLGNPTPTFLILDHAWEVDITGPPFFDFNHGQIGLAPNCIEIHPVVDIVFVNETNKKVEPNPASTLVHHCGTPAGGGGTSRKRGGTSQKKGAADGF